MNISTDIWVWVMAFCILAVYSFLFKQNRAYRLVEHLYVGAAAGYAISVNLQNIVNRGWRPLTQEGQFMLLIPIILGLLLYTRYFKQVAWLSKWSMSYLLGIGSGLSMYGMLNSQLLAQIKATVVPLWTSGNLAASRDSILIMLSVVAVLSYFFMTMKSDGPVGKVALAGRWVLMITFGVSFGNVVMGRISIVLGVIQDILGTWLGIIS